MNNKTSQIFEQLVPFIILGIAIVLIFGLFIVLSYIVVWGLFLGAIIWAIYAIKTYFFPAKKVPQKMGRIIEHDDKE